MVELTNKIHYFSKLDSTMLEAKRCLTMKKECPQVIIAGGQSQGRGRFGRIWFAPKGNLYLSHIQPIQHPIEQIPLIVGVAVAEVLCQLIGNKSVVVTLKHPNDVLVDEKKICGILIEKWEPFYSVGVGINVASAPLIQFYETTYVRCYNPHITVGFLLRCFLTRYHALLLEDFSRIQERLEKIVAPPINSVIPEGCEAVCPGSQATGENKKNY
jgi:BirA family biotin operon repressor/biotin-[acetyl-CoA-carboxylase] ligase